MAPIGNTSLFPALVRALAVLTLVLSGCYPYVAVRARTAPPPPRASVYVGPPRPRAVWVEGHYEWIGNDYVWVDGYWIDDRPGYRWVQPRWEWRVDGYVYVPGVWVGVR